MYTAFFANNKTYGADDINTVMSRLTTQGVSLYNDTGAPLMDLNTAMSSIVSNGADMYDANSCKVIALGSGKFKISKGTYWMPSGACVVFDSDGYTFESDYTTAAGTNGTICYVYLKQGGESATVANEVNVVATGEVDSDAELLATISSSGAVTDKRVFAQAKVAVPTTNIVQKGSVYLGNRNSDEQRATITKTITPQYSGFSYMLIQDRSYGDGLGRIPLLLTESEQYAGLGYYGSVYVKKIGNSLVFSQALNYGRDDTYSYWLF